MSLRTIVVAAALIGPATAAQAVTVQWASLTAATPTGVTGTIGAVGVAYAGPHGAIYTQINNVGSTYAIDPWVDNGYTQGIVNRPIRTDFIALDQGGTKTITFSAPVTDVYLALASWNIESALFSRPFTIVAQGRGRYGVGVFTPNGSNTGFGNAGEASAILKFAGTFSSLSFTDTTENYHALTIGIGGLPAVAGVPEPASWALLIAGFGLTGAVQRRSRRRRIVEA